MKSSFEGRLIGFLSSLISEFEEAKPAASTRIVRLEREEIIRLEKSSGVKTIEIRSGAVWLTGTPANGDLILQQGARFETAGDWPYLIEALEPTEIALLPRRYPDIKSKSDSAA